MGLIICGYNILVLNFGGFDASTEFVTKTGRSGVTWSDLDEEESAC